MLSVITRLFNDFFHRMHQTAKITNLAICFYSYVIRFQQ